MVLFWTASDSISIIVDNADDPPIADAGPDQTVSDADGNGSESVTLDGSDSYDPDGTIVAYEWTEGSTVLGATATVIYDFADYYLPGSISLVNNYGCLVHPLSTDEEIEFIASILKVDEVDVSTVNRGVPYLSSGAIVNDKSGVFGIDCTGPEMMRITSVLRL